MAVLYRDYRPKKFDDLLGQDHIRQVLVNALTKNNIAHAYLFSGPRGTGKTTTARILAKAISCMDRADANPCEKCAICLEINDNSYLDIIEIDAASNRGIDDIRSLKENIAVAPSRGKYKIYVIDEVHMLTKEAFNALLKTIEEPPAHAIFILATTEYQKVPGTILSRCQRLFFNRASDEDLVSLLSKIAKQIKLKIDDKALTLIAKRAEGSYRDALSLLGSITNQEDLSEDAIALLFNLPKLTLVQSVLDNILQGDRATLSAALQEFINKGGNLRVLVAELISHINQQIIDTGVIDDSLITILESLILTLAQAKNSPEPDILISARLFGLAKPNASAPITTMAPPQKIPVTVVAPSITINPTPIPEPPKSAPAPTPTPITPPTPPAPSAPVETKVDTISSSDTTPSVVDTIATPKETSPSGPAPSSDFWTTFAAKIKEQNHALYAIIRTARLASLTDDKFTIGVGFRFYSEILFDNKNRRVVENIAAEITGKPMTLECIVEKDESKTALPPENDPMDAVVEVFEIES